jgi:Phosphate transporter family
VKTQRLNRTFVIPWIAKPSTASRSLDDVMDAIDASAALVRLYRLDRIRFNTASWPRSSVRPRTMGSKIAKLTPVGGFAAEAALSLLIAAQTGVPVSTTHAITGLIVGVGFTRRLSAIRGGVARRIVLGLDPDDSGRVPDCRGRVLTAAFRWCTIRQSLSSLS